jgi:hypothetical protein
MHSTLTYQVFLTRNSEYHLQSHVCVGVRDRRTGQWFAEHPALSRPLMSAFLRTPHLGESLEFDLDGEPLRTSPVLNIEERKRAGKSSGTHAAARPVARHRRPTGEDPRVTR